MGAAMMVQDKSSNTGNREAAKGDPSDPTVTPQSARGVTGISVAVQCLTAKVTPVTPYQPKRLAGRQHRARHGVAGYRARSGAYIGNLGSLGSPGVTRLHWRMAGKMALDRRSVSLGSFPVGPGCGGRGPQKKALCK